MKKAKSIRGTGYKGTLTASFHNLVDTLGLPHGAETIDGKVQASWAFDQGGAIITVYDYKEWGKPVNEVTDWHVGGRNWPDATFGMDWLALLLRAKKYPAMVTK